jgi:hypothetical protein
MFVLYILSAVYYHHISEKIVDRDFLGIEENRRILFNMSDFDNYNDSDNDNLIRSKTCHKVHSP